MAGLGTYEELAAEGVDFASLLKKQEEDKEVAEKGALEEKNDFGEVDVNSLTLSDTKEHEVDVDISVDSACDKNRLQK